MTSPSPSHDAIDRSSPASGFGHLRRVLARFGERADDVQSIPRAFGLQVDAADQAPVEQERPYVVTELALRRRRIDLDAVVKAE